MVNNMKIRVLKDHVAVEEIKEPEQTKSGLYVPIEENASMKGRVVSVGPGVYNKKGVRKAPNYTDGDIVLYSKGSGQKLQLTLDEHLLVLRPEDILAKLH